MLILLLFIILILLLFAMYKEYKEGDNCYKVTGKNNNEFQKLNIYITYFKKTVVWRRCLIATCVATVLIFCITHVRIPTIKEVIMYICIIYTSYYMMFIYYQHLYTNTAYQLVKKSINKIKKKYNQL